MGFAVHQLFPLPRQHWLDGPVRRRHVLYIQGFFPKGPDYYRKLLQNEGEVFAKIQDVDWTCSPLRWLGPFTARCEITCGRGGNRVETVYEFLHWQDLIAAQLNCSLFARSAAAMRGFFAHLAAGAPRRMRQAHWKYFSAWLFPYLLFSALAILSLLTLGWTYEAFTGAGLPLLFKAGLALAAIAFLWKLNRLCWSSLMLGNFAYASAYAGGKAPELETRIEAFAQRMAAAAQGADADEVLIVGHSFGTQIAALSAARALELGAFSPGQTRVKLLSLGDATCHIGCLEGVGASRMRKAVMELGLQDRLPWVVLYSGKDVLCFNTADPPSTLGALETGTDTPFNVFRWPILYDVAFRSALERAQYRRIRWLFFRMHSQFILAARKKEAPFDYFRVICGAQALPLDGARKQVNKAA